MQRESPEALAALVGLDWAHAQHAICVQATGTQRRALLILAHRPEALDAWVQTLRTRFNGQPGAGCLALTKGPLVSARRPEECLVLLPRQPLTLAQYREAFTPSRAQDDPPDAARQVERLLTHRDQRTPLTPHSPTRRALTPLVDHRRRVGGDTGRLTQRLTRALKHSCPHVLQWLPDKETGLFGDVLRRWPTLTAAPRARRTTLEAFCRAHHGRAAEVMDSRLQALKRAMARTTEDGVLTPNVRLVPALSAPRRGTWQALADCDPAIAQHAQAPPACPLVDAVPGAGAVLAPRLLGAFGDQRERFTAAEDLQT